MRYTAPVALERAAKEAALPTSLRDEKTRMVVSYRCTALVPMAQGKHLLPFRTQKLSLAAVTILRFRGKIARCQVIKNETLTGLFFYTFLVTVLFYRCGK